MQALAWHSHYVTGLPRIDEDHRRFLELINRFDPATAGELPPAALLRRLDELDGCIRAHFDYEEALMEEAGFPMVGAHRQMHGVFCRRLDQFRERARGGEDVAAELHAMLQRWVVDHIHNDKSYSGLVYSHLRRRQGAAEGGWLGRAVQRMIH